MAKAAGGSVHQILDKRWAVDRICGLVVFWFACLSLLVAAGSANAQSRIQLPDFSDSSAGVLTRADEARLGEAFLREVLASKDLLDDAEVQAYVTTLVTSWCRRVTPARCRSRL